MKKSIGLLIPSLNEGGAERVVSRLSYILSDEYNVFVIVFEDTYMKYAYGGTLINMGIKARPNYILKMILLIKRTMKLRKIKKNYKLDTVISFMDSPNIVNILSGKQQSKIIISVRNYDYGKSYSVFRKIIKKLYQKADCTVAVSKVISNNLISTYGVDGSKAVTIYNPYDIEQIKFLKSKELESNYKDFFKDGFVFVSVGRNMYQKGFWHLIKSFKLVHNKYSESKLVIIGRDETEGKAKKLVKELNIENNVLFTGSQKNPFQFIGNSDVYVLTSLFEGFPNAMVEAMACGCPVIAADCKSGPREILYDDPNLNEKCQGIEKSDYGILVPAFNIGENWSPKFYDKNEEIIADAMLLYLENKKICEYYAAKSLERAKCFGYEICKEKYINVIESLS
jgi:glycosyltransferase involved in cell wall biosynthesis